jgi:hypothetical protein
MRRDQFRPQSVVDVAGWELFTSSMKTGLDQIQWLSVWRMRA